MTRDEIAAIVRDNTGRHVRITFDDGATQTAVIGSVDDEGFLHNGSDVGSGQPEALLWITDWSVGRRPSICRLPTLCAAVWAKIVP